MHMRGGVAETGTRVLSAESARAMATRTIDHPTGPGSGYGLGWGHSAVGGRTMLSHGGGSNGGRALLAAIPEAGFAYASFVNSSVSDAFQGELQRRIMATFLGGAAASMLGSRPVAAAAPAPGPAGIDRSAFVGTYRRTTTRATIREEGTRLILETEWIMEEAQGTEAYMIGQPTRFEMVPAAPNALRLASADAATPGPLWTFLDPDQQGRFRLLYAGGRLSRRVATP
jgi:hypothetical protein